MDLSTATLFAVVAVLAVNQAVMRVEALSRHPLVFWATWLLDLGMGTAILALGLPGFEDVPPVSWVVGLLFFVHAAQNVAVRQRRLREAAIDEATRRRREVAAEIASRVE